MNTTIAQSAILFLSLLAAAPPLSAQVRPQPVQSQGSQNEEETETPAPEQVIVEREAMKLIDPKVYQVPLQLRPSSFITVVSPATGVISNFSVKPGDKLSAQTELFRLEDDIQELQVRQAEADVAAKQARLAQAKKSGDAEAQAVAQAELKVAEVGLQIANAHLEKTIVRNQEPAEVFRTYAVKGELVTLHQKIVDIGNPSTMTVEIPVNRADVEKDGTIDIKIEDQQVEAKVAAVLPPAEKFEPLRDLYDSLASARLEIDNRDGRLKAGQAVYVSSIPRQTVAEVRNSAIISAEEGQRKVQVIRKSIVRDIAVTVLAPVGADRSYISGPFQADDELVLTTSIPLADGTQLSPKGEDQTASEGPTTRPRKSVGGF
jgi:hypothetical protein